MKQLNEIEVVVNKLAKVIGASKDQLPTYGVSRDFGYPHIEVHNNEYHYVVVERGQELERKSTVDFNELLYWVFSDATHSMAFNYELNNRIEDQDCRRIAFPKQIELMSEISEEMGNSTESDIAEILKNNPYDDKPTKRVNRMRNDNAI